MTKPQSLAINSLRYIPIYGAAASVFDVILVLFGFDIPIEFFVTLALFYIMTVFSRVFHFCLVHRLCIYYGMLIFTFGWIKHYAGGGYVILTPYTIQIRITLLVMGISLITLVIRRYLMSKT